VEDIQDIEAHLKGGIPEADIEALSAYWEICPTLRHSIIKPGKRKGYCQLTIESDEVKKTILTHSEFEARAGLEKLDRCISEGIAL
jgi:type I restriction enzyme M protein